jgi:3-dehydroquinate dehydratase / shikimate dehydrogenase
MLFTSVLEKDIESFRKVISPYKEDIDAIELRLDLLESLDIEKILEIIDKPVVFTLRRKDQGGFYIKDEKKRIADIKFLLKYKPEYFDIEYDTFVNINDLKNISPKTQFICSYHQFEDSFCDIENIYQMMPKGYEHYKIAFQSISSIESLRSLFFTKKYKDLTCIAMGGKGSFARILTPLVGGFLNYVFINKKTADGQIDLKTAVDIYRLNKLSKKTKSFALIGSPVNKSYGHLFFNKLFKKETVDAVYVKIDLKVDELDGFFSYVKKLKIFSGFSVTMPLKEEVIKYLNKIDDTDIGAVNTIDKDLVGYNTDKKGFLAAIENIQVKNKKVVILGAGGAAKAIAFALKEKQANIFIYNRTLAKAKALARSVQGSFGSLNDIDEYDILINTIPYKENKFPLNLNFIKKNKVIMDIISNPVDTLILKKAKEKKCRCVYGYEMYLNQAIYQYIIWLKKKNNIDFFDIC